MTSDTDVDEVRRDRELIEKLRAKEPGAVEAVLEAYGTRLLATARRIVRDEHLAQDVLQDAFMMASRGFDKFDGRSKLSTWLYRVVVNAALMKIRKRSFKDEKPVGEKLPDFLADGHFRDQQTHWTPAAPESAAESEENRELVLAQISNLSEDARNVVLLRDIEGLSTKEAAEVLGITPGNVKIRLHRARQTLRELLDPYFREDAP